MGRDEVALGWGNCTLWLNPTQHDPSPYLFLRSCPQNGNSTSDIQHPSIFLHCPEPLKVKSGDVEQADSRWALLRTDLVAPLPSCAALVQLFILVTPQMIAPVWATTCMRGLPHSYNGGGVYGQVRLSKTTDHCSLAGGYNNFPRPGPSLATIQGFCQ